jgi:hypothetical protein
MLKRIVVLMAFLLPFAYVNAQVQLPAEYIFAAGYNVSSVTSYQAQHTMTQNDIQGANCGLTNFPVVVKVNGVPNSTTDGWVISVSKNGQTVTQTRLAPTSFYSTTITTLNLQVGDVVSISIGLDAEEIPLPNISGLIYLGIQ